MKKSDVVMLVVLLVLSCSNVSYANKAERYMDTNQAKAYKTVIQEKIDKYGRFVERYNPDYIYKGVGYAELIDFNNDGNDELLVCGAGDEEGMPFFEVYSYNGSANLVVHKACSNSMNLVFQLYATEKDGLKFLNTMEDTLATVDYGGYMMRAVFDDCEYVSYWNGNLARFDYETETATDLISDVSSFITDNRVIYFIKYEMSQGVFRYDIKSKLITKASNQIVSSLESCWNNKYLYYYVYDENNPDMEFATYCLDLDSDSSFLFLDNGTKNLQVFGDKVYYAPFSGDNTSTDLYVCEIDGTNKQVLIPGIVDFKIVDGKIYYAKCQKDYGSNRADFNIQICEIDGTNSICISDNFAHQCLHRIDADGVYIDTGSLIEHYEYSSHQDKVISVTINGIKVVFDQTPIIKENRTLVPLRAIFEALNATVDWNDATKTVTSTKGNTSVSMTIGHDIFYKNGEAIQLDVPAQIVGGRTLIPVRSVAESFDCEVKWDPETQTVIIMN